MKANKFMLVALFAGALAMVSCDQKPVNPPIIDDGGDDTEVVLEEAPALEAPGAGKVTIAVRAPKGTCNGLVAVGAATNEDGTDDWNPGAQTKKFAKVEGTESWHQITLPANPGMAVKVIAINEQGNADWGTQWGMNVEGEDPNVIIIEGDGALDNSENNGEVKLIELSENTVVYVDVVAWKSEPCVPKNEAGKATFVVTVPAETPATAMVSVTGSFTDNAWTPGAYTLTRQENGTYTGEFEVPAAFEYKYIIGAEGTDWSWDYEEVVSGNRQMVLDLKVADTVEAWKAIPGVTE